jgi:L-ascorbate metabolism protein UlaG (beta-lactamase superfamily)
MNHRFPLSDHYDGRHFFNPGPQRPARGLREVLRWRLRGRRAAWPGHVSNQVFPPPPDTVGPDNVAITFINHASFLIHLPGAVVLTDPIFSQRCSPVSWAGPKRVRPPGIALADLPRPDVVLLSHNHYDHMDFPSLRALQARYAPRFVTTLGNSRTLAKLGIAATELDWWQDTSAGFLRITATPARHFSARTPFDRNRTLWGGFMISAGAGSVLFAGDSGTGPHWADIRTRLGAPDVALLPIGAYEPRWFMAPVHMNPAEAVEAHLTLGARQSVGMHFGTFQLTDEAIDAPLHALDAALGAIRTDTFSALDFGETRVYRLGLPPDLSGYVASIGDRP